LLAASWLLSFYNITPTLKPGQHSGTVHYLPSLNCLKGADNIQKGPMW
jgi:hypothetical protein